jgi:PAS domain S-box-containing protein
LNKNLLAHSAAIICSDFTALLAAKDRHIVWANDAMHRIFGYEPGELIGQPTRKLFVDQESYDSFAERVTATLVDSKSYSAVHVRKRKNGTAGWYQCNISRLEGQPEVFVGSFIDETSRHDLLVELEVHRTVVQDQTELISRFLPDRTFTFVNDVYCRLFNKSREELIGFNWQPVAHPDDMPLIDAKLASMSPANPVVTIENRVNVGGGEWRWFQFVNRGLYGADGCLKVVQSVGRDVTSLKAIERSHRENEERLDLALVASGLVLWDWDVADRTVKAGSRWSEILGYSDQELGVTEEAWRGLIHPNDLKTFTEKIAEHFQGDRARFECEHRLKHKEGHWVTVLAHGKVTLRDKDGAVTRMIGTTQDISQRKRLNEEGLALLKRIEVLINESSPKNDANSEALENLTKRERQILGLIAEGMTSTQIAAKIGVATNTVISHRQKLMLKLDLHSVAEVIRFALDHVPSKKLTTK